MGLVGVLEPLEPLKAPCSSRWVKMAAGCYFDLLVFSYFSFLGRLSLFNWCSQVHLFRLQRVLK